MNAATDRAPPAAGTGANDSSTPAGAADARHGEALALPSIGAPARAGTRPILALGAWFKHAACLLEDGHARFGPNLGDLDNADACRGVEPAVAALLAASAHPPRAVAHDLHPDFHSTRVALATAARLGVPAIGVQHHHAHAGAVLAEHGRFDARPVLALALDGVGLGSDGGAWGGELLWVAGAEFVRLGHLRPLRLPGGDRAAREPWRMAAALLHAGGRGAEIARRFARQPAAAQLAQVLARPALCPPTTSLGRHFDAAAGLLGICEVMGAEAEAALALEALAARSAAPEVAPGDWHILTHPAAPAPAADGGGRSAGRFGAARFQATVAVALVDWVERARIANGCDTVVLCGGCLHNRLLSAALESALGARGLTVLGVQRLSPGDAGLALGQAWVAHHRLAAQES
ncbi:carbamoyltransferase HypF [Thauera aromatica]|nr:carbamoyltransferase HypF [Thauera aromatica]MCK2126788.1 carbamoyltransferase HypF [Thauera aromatica]